MNFYKQLYSSKIKRNLPLENYFFKETQIPKLIQDDKILCEEILTIEECAKALKQLANDKSPGSDGLTTNFYKFFWIDIRDLLYDSFIYSLKTGNLSNEQKLGVLNLLPKENKDHRFLSSWRPISLLQTDYKILTKALALRLQKVLPNIIHPDQVGYIPGRYIGENVRTLKDLMTYTATMKIPGYIVLVDFEKAFDSIEWDFLFKTLEAFNFGPKFIDWIRLLYTDISSCVGNNGYYSNYFKLTRGIRQGCPISALLFILVAEILAISLRQDTSIHGINLCNTIFKIKMLADDTTLLLKDIKSIEIAIKKFQDFSKCSGLKLNLNKTEIIPIGNASLVETSKSISLKKINVKKGPYKSLGVWFSNNQNEMVRLNFDERLIKIKKLLHIWSSRILSLRGKITVLKTLVLPKILFLFSMIYVPDEILKIVDNLFFNFLWNNKPPKIKKSTITGMIKDGGLKMVDVYKMHIAAKCSWIKRLCNESKGNWKILFSKMLSISQQMLNKNLPASETNNCLSNFHKQVLDNWLLVHSADPKSNAEILNQYVFYNRNITIGNKYITLDKFENKFGWNLKLIDILDKSGNVLKKNILNTKLESNLTLMFYNSLVSSIPQRWTDTIKNTTDISNISRRLDDVCLKIKDKYVVISKVTSKMIYEMMIEKDFKTPVAITSWIDLFPFLENHKWADTFILPFEVIQETYLQSFQYKILNRILNCNYNLHKWGIKESPKCNFCENVDTLTHHLFECKESLKFWREVEAFIYEKLGIRLHFTICEIIFGVPLEGDPLAVILNYIFILGKHYINKNRSNSKDLIFLEFKYILHSKIEVLLRVENKIKKRLDEDGFNLKWHYFELLNQ